MALKINTTILFLDLCIFLKSIKTEYRKYFVEYFSKEISSEGINEVIPDYRVLDLVSDSFQSVNLLKRKLNELFGKDERHDQLYQSYLDNERTIARLAEDIKKRKQITDCKSARLCDVFGLPPRNAIQKMSVDELGQKGYKKSYIESVLAELVEMRKQNEQTKSKIYLINNTNSALSDKQRILLETLKKCNVLYRGDCISNEHIMQSLETFFVRLCSADEHVTGLSFHTGSICFTVMDILFVALMCIINNSIRNDDIISGINTGDKVEYKGKMYTYMGEVDYTPDPRNVRRVERRLLIENDKEGKCYLPLTPPPAIVPYKGRAVKNVGRRNEKSKRTTFLTNVMGYSSAEVTGVISTAAVVVMKKSIADEVINNLQLSYNNEIYDMTELIRISYFTDSNTEIKYKGNADNNEASIKICPSLDVAAEQLSDVREKENILVAVLDERVLTKDYANLDRFLNNSLLCSYIASPLSLDTAETIIEQSENKLIHACTKEYLCERFQINTEAIGEIGILNQQMSTIVDKSVETFYLESNELSWANLSAVKRELKLICESEYDSDNIIEFVILSHSLINLLQTAVFDISFMNDSCSRGIIDIESPENRLNKIIELTSTFPGEIQDNAIRVKNYIQRVYESLLKNNPKWNKLESLISDNADQRILIVAPKAYYENLIEQSGVERTMIGNGSISVCTNRKLRHSGCFDLLIMIGQDCHFYPEFSLTSDRIVYLIYDCEKRLYKYTLRRSRRLLELLNPDYHFDPIEFDDVDDTLSVEDAINQDEYIDTELEQKSFEVKLNKLSKVATYDYGGMNNNILVKAAAKLEDGRRVLFSTHYKAYVYDVCGEIQEKSIDEIAAGDVIIFTSRNSLTNDIVSDILESTKDSLNNSNRDCYDRTLYWKKRLKEYVEKHKLSTQEVWEQMKRKGLSVEPQTVRVWMDDYARVICPQSAESLRIIGEFVGDSDLSGHYMDYYESGKVVKKIRTNIRGIIKSVVMTKMTNGSISNSSNKDSVNRIIEEYVSDNYQRIVDLGVVESIREFDRWVSPNCVNRPLDLQEV